MAYIYVLMYVLVWLQCLLLLLLCPKGIMSPSHVSMEPAHTHTDEARLVMILHLCMRRPFP